MYQLCEANAAVLRVIQKLGESTCNEVSDAVGFDAVNAINSLRRCGYVIVAKTVMRVLNCRGGTCSKPVNSYSVTDKGRLSLHNRDFPPARQMKALKVPAKKQELHSMQYFTIADRDPNVREMVAEVDGREIKITYGVNFKYEPYVPPRDLTRWKSNPIKGIHAL